MNQATEKARRRIRKIANYLDHVRPGNDGDMEDIERWARAKDAASIIEGYLQCAKDT